MLLSASLLAGCHKPVPRTKTMPITESTVLPSGGSNLALEQTLSAADHALFAAVYTPAAFTPEEGTLRPNATWDAAKLATLQRARADFAQPSPYFSLANVETALARGANPNAVCDGLTPLIHAASACHPAAPAIVNRLIAAGADVNAQPSFWASPLTNAVQLLAISQPVTDDHLVGTTPPIDPFPAIIKSLLRAGANP
ncbi:MAG TPA: hypothetical protein VJJ83_02580, partial [Candidatus Babeliales bacterium]|nr:hypothetical protein [Candidatus Babeliales bacterium]